jgi:hypothetical protein
MYVQYSTCVGRMSGLAADQIVCNLDTEYRCRVMLGLAVETMVSANVSAQCSTVCHQHEFCSGRSPALPSCEESCEFLSSQVGK